MADRVVVIGANIGVARAPRERTTTPHELHKGADMALYDAKRAGRNTWRWDDRSRLMASNDLMEAIED